MKKEVLRREVCSGIAIDGKENKLESDKAVMMEGSRKREKIGESPLGSFLFPTFTYSFFWKFYYKTPLFWCADASIRSLQKFPAL